MGFTIVAVLVSHQTVAGSRPINAAVADAVPGFDCPDMRVETSRGFWSTHEHDMRAALRLRPQCLIDLKRRIRTSPQFRADRCHLVEQCWIRESGPETYTFTFYPAYVGFHFKRRR